MPIIAIAVKFRFSIRAIAFEITFYHISRNLPSQIISRRSLKDFSFIYVDNIEKTKFISKQNHCKISKAIALVLHKILVQPMKLY